MAFQLTLPHILIGLGMLYLAYRLWASKGTSTKLSKTTVLPSVSLSDDTVGVTDKIKQVLSPRPTLEPMKLLTIEQKPIVSLVSEWVDLRDAAQASGATDAVKKLDDLFPLLNKPATEKKDA